ncbi:hypothetical protein [Rufibacter hautae]|uniref:Uncharacterized protein n=1 Tax=Rufibacter hautae TaxID=2595005 RepID=A0A5B6TCF9_9BACT|nr:hypothetical protein [Rufibacter hautae]KAA3436669.1 hypothetical protein FOA19_20010 [Rufibacter hautae]
MGLLIFIGCTILVIYLMKKIGDSRQSDASRMGFISAPDDFVSGSAFDSDSSDCSGDGGDCGADGGDCGGGD